MLFGNRTAFGLAVGTVIENETLMRDELRLHIGGRYPLCEAAAAHQQLASRKTQGKLVLLP